MQFPSGKELNIVTINRLSREIYWVFFYGKKGKISMKATRHNGRSGKHLVNEKEAEAFDRAFPYMEKKKLPGQIFFNLANFIKSLFFSVRLYFSKK